MHELKISKARVGCLVGKKGDVKRDIERRTGTKVKIGSDGDVEIYGDGFGEYICEKVIKAIGRGFNPEVALTLVRERYGLEVIDIKRFCGGNKKKCIRIKARLIGTRGKARRVMERLTGCDICIYGNTVSLIGEHDRLMVAFRGVEKLLQGSPHGNVYGYLEREMKRLRSRV